MADLGKFIKENKDLVDKVYAKLEKEEYDALRRQYYKVLYDAKEAVNTTWRFIGAFKGENDVPIEQALEIAEYHLKQIDYIFEEEPFLSVEEVREAIKEGNKLKI